MRKSRGALCRNGKLLPDLGVATLQLLAETTLGPAAYHLTDGFTTGSVATLTAGIEEGELLRELGEEQGVTGLIDRDSLVVLLLLVETQAKHLHLHGKHVVGHSLGKTDAGICLLSGLLQNVEDDATTEADDGRTATIYIHHTVGIRQGKLSLCFEPLAELLAHTGQLHHAVTTLQQIHCLEDVVLLLLGVSVMLTGGAKDVSGILASFMREEYGNCKAMFLTAFMEARNT